MPITGTLDVIAASDFETRIPLASTASGHGYGMGRELFGNMRKVATASEQGACTLFADVDQ